jgi:hypothetical protein
MVEGAAGDTDLDHARVGGILASATMQRLVSDDTDRRGHLADLISSLGSALEAYRVTHLRTALKTSAAMARRYAGVEEAA